VLPQNNNPPLWFPANVRELEFARGPELNALLTFYGVEYNPGERVPDKMRKLRLFLAGV
jgi:hypothetical protein